MSRTLKTAILVSIALLGGTCGSTFAQEYFPLHVGNEWHYHWYSYDYSGPVPEFDSGDYIVKVLRDTVMSNQQRYAVLSRVLEPEFRRYLRGDTGAVFAYDTSTQTEYMLYNLTAAVNESWQLPVAMHTTVEFTSGGQDSLFGHLQFTREYRVDPGLVGATDVRLARDFGPFFKHNEGEPPGTRQTDTRLKGCIIDGQVYGILLSAERPVAEGTFALQQCYPNPPAASSNITIPFSLARAGHIELRLYDALGRERATLANGLYTGGAHRISFSARSLARGVYYYRLSMLEGSATKTMLLR
jgi:hypothetical protein